MVRVLAAVVLVMVATADVHAQAAGALQYGMVPVTMTREACARRVMATLAAEQFPFAEVTADGSVRGWNAKTAVLAIPFPMPNPDQISAAFFVASSDATESTRLGGVLRTAITEGKDAPDAKARIAPANVKVPPAPLSLHSKCESRAASNILRHFSAAAAIATEKLGLAPKVEAPVLVTGFATNKGTAAFVTQTGTSVVQVCCVTVTPGEKPAEKLTEELLNSVVKILFD